MKRETDAARLLTAARAGSADALGTALDACRAYLLIVAERELHPAVRAKGGASDLVQQTFLEAHRDFGRFHGDSQEELLAWLRQVLRNNLANFTRQHLQTKKRQADLEVRLGSGTAGAGESRLAGSGATASRLAMAGEDAAALEAAMAQLPDDYRQVLTLRYQEGRSFEEIAQRIGRSANAARKLWARAVERLERELGPRNDSR
jgi:RNA polymerase sigma-70 factor (ECF subfamily)